MKRILIAAAATTLTATTALAGIPFSGVDSDGDDRLTYDEMSAVYANLSSEDFKAIDANGDSQIDPYEAKTPKATEILAEAEGKTTGIDLDIDLEGNQTMFYTYDEATARYPDLTSKEFQSLDKNGDNRLDAVELRQPAATAVLDSAS